MHYKNEDAFGKAWKAGTRHGAYLLYGSENYLIQRWAARITKEAGGDAFNLHRFDGKKLDLEGFYGAVEALPLMAASKCVLVDDLDWKGLAAPQQKELTAILADLPADCVVIVTAKAPGFDQKSAGGKKLIALLDKAGCAVELGSRGSGGLTSFLKAEAKKGGCSLSSDLCRHILATCDNDMLALQGEVAKLCAFAGGGELTREMVDAICIPRAEARVFDLSKAILAGNADKALGMLDTLFYLRESPVMILSVLSRSYVDLYRARIAKDEGRGSADVAAMFGYRGREFVVKNAFSASAGLSGSYLRQCLAVLQDCDLALKSSGVDDRALLEQAVVRLFALRSAERR